MTVTDTSATSVSVETDVEAPLEHTFRAFTERMLDWWDPQHHLLDGEVVSMTVEPRVGGHIVDRYSDGRECQWARVLAFEPPHRIVFSWDVNTRWQLEADPERASEVAVTFTATGPDRTHVTLVHRHLDRHGEGWESMRDAVGRGWDLRDFAEFASR